MMQLALLGLILNCRHCLDSNLLSSSVKCKMYKSKNQSILTLFDYNEASTHCLQFIQLVSKSEGLEGCWLKKIKNSVATITRISGQIEHMYCMKRLTCSTGKFYTQSFDPWVTEKIYHRNLVQLLLSHSLCCTSKIFWHWDIFLW